MSDLLRDRLSGRLPSFAFNPLLLFFAMLLAGIPSSYFYELMTNPFSRNLCYWTDVNRDAHIPFSAIKSSRQRNGIWQPYDVKHPGHALVAMAPPVRKALRRDSMPVRRPLPAFRERP